MPCSRGERSLLTGERCPYVEHAPLTASGYEVWDVIQRGAGQLRHGPHAAVLGFDIQALVSISTALGYDPHPLLHLFHYAELGLQQAIQQHDNRDHP